MELKVIMKKRIILLLSPLVATMLLFTHGCNESPDSVAKEELLTTCPSNAATINGTGATFPDPLYQVWITQYQGVCPNQNITYKPTGSGKGAKATINMTTTFGASDGGFSEDELQQNPNLIMLPITGGGIAVAYNLLQAPEIRLSRDVLVEIFSGTITNWKDPKIQKDNPHYALPNLPITVVVRGDSSGSTQTFSRYLAENKSWKEQYGVSKEISFPQKAIRADGGSDLANKLTQNFGSIGYLETGKAKTTGLSVAAIQNRENRFVLPLPDTIQNGLGSIALDNHLSGYDGNPKGENAYPIVNYTWLLYNKLSSQSHPDNAEAFKRFVEYALTPVAQETGIPLGYVPLSPEVNKKVSEALDSLN